MLCSLIPVTAVAQVIPESSRWTLDTVVDPAPHRRIEAQPARLDLQSELRINEGTDTNKKKLGIVILIATVIVVGWFVLGGLIGSTGAT